MFVILKNCNCDDLLLSNIIHKNVKVSILNTFVLFSIINTSRVSNAYSESYDTSTHDFFSVKMFRNISYYLMYLYLINQFQNEMKAVN